MAATLRNQPDGDCTMATQKLLKAVGVDTVERLPEFAWPGGYPIVYMDTNGTELCTPCARRAAEYSGETTNYYIHYEGPPIHCENDCGAEIESAYGIDETRAI